MYLSNLEAYDAELTLFFLLWLSFGYSLCTVATAAASRGGCSGTPTRSNVKQEILDILALECLIPS